MFKKKKKEIKVPVKKEPEILKVLKTNRIVVQEIPLTNSENIQIGWQKQLVIEEIDTNAMQEPFWRTRCIDVFMVQKPNSYMTINYQEELMWKILRETYLND